MNIYIGADHRGFALKKQILDWLSEKGKTVIDIGNTTLDPADDYPDFAFALGEKVAAEKDSMGILLCGSGAGITVAANKVKGIRAALITTEAIAEASRKDDDLNVLGISSDFTSLEEAKKLISTFLSTPFSGEDRHNRRIKKITTYEQH